MKRKYQIHMPKFEGFSPRSNTMSTEAQSPVNKVFIPSLKSQTRSIQFSNEETKPTLSSCTEKIEQQGDRFRSPKAKKLIYYDKTKDLINNLKEKYEKKLVKSSQTSTKIKKRLNENINTLSENIFMTFQEVPSIQNSKYAIYGETKKNRITIKTEKIINSNIQKEAMKLYEECNAMKCQISDLEAETENLRVLKELAEKKLCVAKEIVNQLYQSNNRLIEEKKCMSTELVIIDKKKRSLVNNINEIDFKEKNVQDQIHLALANLD